MCLECDIDKEYFPCPICSQNKVVVEDDDSSNLIGHDVFFSSFSRIFVLLIPYISLSCYPTLFSDLSIEIL